MRMRSPGLWGVRGGARRGCSCWTCAHLLGAWVLPHLLDQRAEVGVELLRACQQPGTRAHTVHRRRPGVNSRVCECGRDVHLRVGPPSSRLLAASRRRTRGEGRVDAARPAPRLAGPQTSQVCIVSGASSPDVCVAPRGVMFPCAQGGWVWAGGFCFHSYLSSRRRCP